MANKVGEGVGLAPFHSANFVTQLEIPFASI